MKKILFLIFITIGLAAFAQQEDPGKVLSYGSNEKLSGYLENKGWKGVKGEFKDEWGEVYYLYKKKSAGGGWAYIAIHPKKFMHYQVFFANKKDYSPVLSYDDLLHMPEGKSKFNRSTENTDYAIKSVEFDDPIDTRNINLFYGKIQLVEGQEVKKYELSEEEEKQLEYQEELEEEEQNIQLYLDDQQEKQPKPKKQR
ncbi:MAG: hypothetical protein COA57_07655 [Flavobacteriales bacterium]|nr:MAG: hypothetical protein COA57_07655 [Flavobacteriales bacterium]